MSAMVRGYRCDATLGLVFGKRLKRAIGRVDGRGYIEISSAGIVGLSHRMIWESVHGPIPKGMQINHINGIKTDNRISNLELVTPSQNTLHAYRMKLCCADGEKNGRAKLTVEKVREIRTSTELASRIAERLGVSPGTIRDIRNGRRWRVVV
jgi:DNA-binding transcriptional regulator YiaG